MRARYQAIPLRGREPIARNEFLCTKNDHDNFDLRLKFKVVGKGANAGVQFRSRRIPDNNEVVGYQADLGDKYWGSLYDESRRKTTLAKPDSISATTLARLLLRSQQRCKEVSTAAQSAS